VRILEISIANRLEEDGFAASAVRFAGVYLHTFT
jgi:hypothetical protein